MTAITVGGIVIPSSDPLFLSVIGLHVMFSLASVLSGLVAMLTKKRRGRHSYVGTIYFWCMSGTFLSMAILSFMRWSEDWMLFVLGISAFVLVVAGRIAIKRGWGLRIHAVYMSTSYIVLLTAFYVDNGKNLPIWRDMAPITYWTIPALVGVPLILWTLAKHPLLRRQPSRIQIDTL